MQIIYPQLFRKLLPIVALAFAVVQGRAATVNLYTANFTSGAVDANDAIPYSSGDLTSNYIGLNPSNYGDISTGTGAAFRGTYNVSDIVTPTPATDIAARLTEQGSVLTYSLVNLSSPAVTPTAGSVNFSVAWGFAISPTALSDISAVNYSLGSIQGNYSVIVQDASTGNYYISDDLSQPLFGGNPTTAIDLGPTTMYSEISNNLGTIGTPTLLGNINIDYLGIYNSSPVDLTGLAQYTQTGFTSLYGLNYTESVPEPSVISLEILGAALAFVVFKRRQKSTE